jgi:hypothetical protein
MISRFISHSGQFDPLNVLVVFYNIVGGHDKPSGFKEESFRLPVDDKVQHGAHHRETRQDNQD